MNLFLIYLKMFPLNSPPHCPTTSSPSVYRSGPSLASEPPCFRCPSRCHWRKRTRPAWRWKSPPGSCSSSARTCSPCPWRSGPSASCLCRRPPKCAACGAAWTCGCWTSSCRTSRSPCPRRCTGWACRHRGLCRCGGRQPGGKKKKRVDKSWLLKNGWTYAFGGENDHVLVSLYLLFLGFRTGILL